MSDLSQELKFFDGQDVIVAYTAAEATGTLRLGSLYRISASTLCFIRFGGTAVTAANGGAMCAVEPSAPVFVRATSATVRAIQFAAGGSIICSRVDEGT